VEMKTEEARSTNVCLIGRFRNRQSRVADTSMSSKQRNRSGLNSTFERWVWRFGKEDTKMQSFVVNFGKPKLREAEEAEVPRGVCLKRIDSDSPERRAR